MDVSIARPDRIEYFLKMAELVSLRGTCPRASVGVVLTFNNRIVSTAYNSAPTRLKHCTEEGCLVVADECIRTVHAEAAAVAELHSRYSRLVGYGTHQPCYDCLKLMYLAGVNQYYFLHPYTSGSKTAKLLANPELAGIVQLQRVVPARVGYVLNWEEGSLHKAAE